MLTLVFGLYCRRYRDKELVTAAALFNVFVFAVLSVLSNVEFGLAAGFGLFAILALFSLRSEPISETEITYFFGSVAIAVICSVAGTTLPFVGAVTALVVLGAYVIDHPGILRSVDGVKITLDKIDGHALSDPAAMRQQLSQRGCVMHAGTIAPALIAALMLAAGPAKAQQRRTFEVGGQLRLAHDNFGGLHSDSGERRSATYLRRARLGATWRPARDWRLGAELDADSEGKVTLRSAAVDWKGLADTTLTFGRFDPDFGLEQAISSKWTTAIERSAAWDLLPDVAESLDGIGLQLAHAGDRYYISAGAFDKPDARSLLARAVFAPWAASGRVLHLGLSLAAEGIDAGGDGRIRSRLGVRGVSEHGDGNRVTLADALDTAGANPFDRERSRALELAVASGPYSLQAEALRRELSGSGGGRVASGQYLQLAWTVTGQARPYDLDGAKFKAIEPAAGSGGAWELFYRHDRLAVRGAAPTRSSARVHTLGVNWYATAALRLSLNGSSARSDTTVNDAGDDSGQALGLRLQLVF